MTEPAAPEILPPAPPRNPRPSDGIHYASAEPEPLVLSDELPPELEFDPVPHVPKRGMKFTAEKQRIFVGALAACGSVTVSAAAVNMSTGQIYHLRQRAGGESFAAAWDKAVERGALQVRDVLVDQAINGIPEYVYGPDGKLLFERRRFNTRMMMWIVAHHLPDRYGVAGGLMHSNGSPLGMKRLKEQWRKEWSREHLENERRRADTSRDKIATMINAIRSGFKRNIAEDPAKRAAWELLTGPTDWSDFEKVPMYGRETPTNQQRPDMVVANAMGMDALFGMRGEAAEAEAGGDEKA